MEKITLYYQCWPIHISGSLQRKDWGQSQSCKSRCNDETEQVGLAACHNESQTWETSAGAKRKMFIQLLPPENGGLLSQRPSHLPAQACSSHGHSEGRTSFLHPTILLAFGLGFCPFIFLAFGVINVKTSPSSILASGRDSPGDPWLSMVSGPVGR